MGSNLRAAAVAVFSKCAVLRPAVRAYDTGRDARPRRGRRERRSVLRGRLAEHPPETRRERTDARKPDVETDLCHRPIRRAQEPGGPLEPTGEQVRVRRLAERALEGARE